MGMLSQQSSAFPSSVQPALSLQKPPSHKLRGRGCLLDLRPQHCQDPEWSPDPTPSCWRPAPAASRHPQNLLVVVSDNEGGSCEWLVGCCCSSQILVLKYTLPSELETYDVWLLMGQL